MTMRAQLIAAFLATSTIDGFCAWSFTVRPSFTGMPLRTAADRSSGSMQKGVRPLKMALDHDMLSSLMVSVDDLKTSLDHNVFSSLMVSADDVADAAQGLVDAVTPAVTDAAQSAVEPAADAASTATQNGWFGFLAKPIEGLIAIIHSVLVAMGVSANAWGVSILGMTVLIKLLTYPLTKQQLESTSKMQLLQPRVKEIQSTYQSNPEVMNQKISELYQSEQVNPLAGCIPAIVQLPVFIGLYRSILTLSKEDRLSEPFLWLPSLEGPVYGADPAHGSDWILKGWVDGVPSLGWDDTLAFLSLPVLLVITQFISQALITPKEQQQQGNIVIKLLPLLIGWFSLNVPSALGIYWVANNIITTLLTLQIRSGMEMAPAASSGGGVTVEPPQPAFRPAPMREKPSGFAAPAPFVSDDGVKPITPMDAEIVADAEEVVESVAEGVQEEPVDTPPTPRAAPKKRGGKKKRKKKN